jgi:hypothetical protein
MPLGEYREHDGHKDMSFDLPCYEIEQLACPWEFSER